jgi:HEAT repeat protein
MEAFFSESFDEAFQRLDEYNQPIIALQKIGPSALEPALDYLKKSKEEESRFGIDKALSIIVKFRDERSFTALIDALSHPDDYVKEVAVDLLEEYGDARAVEHLKKLLEHDDWRKYVASAISKLVTNAQAGGQDSEGGRRASRHRAFNRCNDRKQNGEGKQCRR